MSTGIGKKTITPTRKALINLAGSTLRPATTADAPTNERVTSGTPTPRLTSVRASPSSAGSSAPKIPIGAPSANEGQNRRP